MQCSGCGRRNGPRAKRCLYCGVALEAESAPESLPPNIDELIRAGMRGGSFDQLKAALGAPSGGSAPAARSPAEPALVEPLPSRAEAAPSARTDPRSASSGSATTAPPQPRGASPVPLSHELLSVAARLADALYAGDPGPSRRRLHELREVLSQVDAQLSALSRQEAVDEPAALPVSLPPFRQPWALPVNPRGRTRGQLQNGLGIDVLTAQQLSIGASPRVALRAADRASLEARAASFGPDAVVVSREQLIGLGHAWLVCGSDAPGQLRLEPRPVWLEERPSCPPGQGYTPLVTLVVPGEVQLRRFRSRSGRRSSGGFRELGGRRSGVVDLHGPGVFARAVEWTE